MALLLQVSILVSLVSFVLPLSASAHVEPKWPSITPTVNMRIRPYRFFNLTSDTFEISGTGYSTPSYFNSTMLLTVTSSATTTLGPIASTDPASSNTTTSTISTMSTFPYPTNSISNSDQTTTTTSILATSTSLNPNTLTTDASNSTSMRFTTANPLYSSSTSIGQQEPTTTLTATSFSTSIITFPTSITTIVSTLTKSTTYSSFSFSSIATLTVSKTSTLSPLPTNTVISNTCVPGTFTCNSATTFSQCVPNTVGTGTYVFMGSVAAGMQCVNGAIIRQNAGPCTPNGSLQCKGEYAFYLCDQGGLVSMGPVAPGTTCHNGTIAAV